MSAPRQTLEQRRADAAAAVQEFHQIRKFVAACRRQGPGAMIVLRPDSAPTGANALDVQKAQTRRKAFKRAIRDSIARAVVASRELDGVQFIWLVTQEGLDG
jgi:hypothetical protein